jgi:hypothetical protein
MNDETENVIVFGMFLGGTVAVLFGVFMWQGGWAALAAVGVLTALLAMSQSLVLATSAGARSIVKKIVRVSQVESTNVPGSDRRPVIGKDFGVHKESA